MNINELSTEQLKKELEAREIERAASESEYWKTGFVKIMRIGNLYYHAKKTADEYVYIAETYAGKTKENPLADVFKYPSIHTAEPCTEAEFNAAVDRLTDMLKSA